MATQEKKKRRTLQGPSPGPVAAATAPALSVAILPFGRDMMQSALVMTCKKLEGEGVATSRDEFEAGTTTHVVASQYATEEKLLDWMSPTPLAAVQLVTMGWVLYVVRHKQIPEFGQFQWVEANSTSSSSSSSSRISSLGGNSALGGRVGEMDLSGWQAGQRIGSWMDNVPVSARAACARHLQLGAHLGVALPTGLEPTDPTSDFVRPRLDPRRHYAVSKSGTAAMANENRNEHLTAPLRVVQEHWEVCGDQWRKMTYKRVGDILASLAFKVTDADQVRNYRGIGGNMLERIKTILDTGSLPLAEEVAAMPRTKAVAALCKIHGVGSILASELFNKGCESVADVREKLAADPGLLPEIPTRALKYYEDMQERIPRAEVEQIGAHIGAVAKRIWANGGKRKVVGEICGSYRRGNTSSGDVDFIITTPGTPGCPPLSELIGALREEAFIVDDLTKIKQMPINKDGQVAEKQMYMGFCKLKGKDGDGKEHRVRRVDIKIYTPETFAFALLYFTGSGHFNRSMRNYVRRRHYSMNDTGIYLAVHQGKNRVSKALGSVCQARTEQDIFKWLGFEYKAPNERSCYSQEYAEKTAAHIQHQKAKNKI